MTKQLAAEAHAGCEPTEQELHILESLARWTADFREDRHLTSLVAKLTDALGMSFLCVALFDEDPRYLTPIAAHARDASFNLADFPRLRDMGEEDSNGHICLIPKGIRSRFPQEKILKKLRGEAFFALPLTCAQGQKIGLLAGIHDAPLERPPMSPLIGKIVANHIVAELDRQDRVEAIAASEERYRELFDSAPICYVTINPAGHVTQANKYACRMFRMPMEQLVGLHVFDLHPPTPEGQDRSREVFSRFKNGHDIIEEEMQFQRGDGSIGWGRLTVHTVVDEQGRTIGSRSIILDITERYQAESARQQSEVKYRQILSSALDAIITIDQNDRVILFNKAAEETFRCSADTVLGKPVDPLLTDELESVIQENRDHLKRSGEESSVWAPSGLRARRADGEDFPIEATLSITDLDTQQLCTIILRDVNDRQMANQQIQKLQSVTNYLREELESEQHYKEIVGNSPALLKVLDSVERVAGTDAGVLILGETGTGKELIARAIHLASSRRDRPLIKVNCAAIPRTLVESELFGHEKGAFTGANRTKIGRFELADGGTIFLDEIGEIPPFVQVKLLRVLQERSVERLGGTESKPIDVRVIAATNRNLEGEVRSGRFRADLFFRLNVFPIRVPCLRERPEDVPQLVMHFVELYAQRFGRRISGVSPECLERLQLYPWPGNIRELENLVERAVILNSDGILDIPQESLHVGVGLPSAPAPSHGHGDPVHAQQAEGGAAQASTPPVPPNFAPIPPAQQMPGTHPPQSQPHGQPLPNNGHTPVPAATQQMVGQPVSLEEVERRHIIAVLDTTDWVIGGDSGAAKVLDMHPNTLRSRMKKLGIKRAN